MKTFRNISVLLCTLLSALAMNGNVMPLMTSSSDYIALLFREVYGDINQETEHEILTRYDGGYFDAAGSPHYYITDWQGNNAAVVNSSGAVVQNTDYYPYGEPTVEPSGQRYLFGGKEREHAAGRNTYDFGARSLTPYGIWPSPDPFAEKFYPISPYSFCGGDPINRVDKDGKQFISIASPLLGVSNPLIIASKPVVPKPVVESVSSKNPIEWHHIIPKSAKGETVVKDAISKGFKFDGKDNLIPVEKFIRATGTGRHGNHPKYSHRIVEKLAQESSNQQSPIETVTKVVNEAKKAITDNPTTKINDLQFQIQFTPTKNDNIIEELKKMMLFVNEETPTSN